MHALHLFAAHSRGDLSSPAAKGIHRRQIILSGKGTQALLKVRSLGSHP
jgi:hypothetical protein